MEPFRTIDEFTADTETQGLTRPAASLDYESASELRRFACAPAHQSGSPVQPNDFTYLGNADAASFHDDGRNISLRPDNDLIAKYTYKGDFNLDGKVDFADALILGIGYDPPNPGIYDWGVGDTNFGGSVNFTDASALAILAGLGTGSSSGAQL